MADNYFARKRREREAQRVQVTGGDPKLPHETRKAANEADASVYDPAQSAANVRKTDAETRRTEQLLPVERREKEASARKAEREAAQPTEAELKAQSEQKRAQTILSIMGEVRRLYDQDIKGQPASRLFGLTEKIDSIPANERFRAAGANILPLIRPLIAQSAKEGDSDREMLIFESYVPSNDDSDATIEQKFKMLEMLIGGMVDGKPPSQTLAAPPPPNLDVAPVTGPSQNRYDPDLSGALDGLIRAGAPFERANQWAISQGGTPLNAETYAAAVRYAKQNPDYKGSLADVTVQSPTNLYQRTIGNAVNAGGEGVAAGGVAAANALSLGLLDELSPDQAQAQMTKDLLRERNPGASLTGDIIGSASAMTGLNALLRGGGKVAQMFTRGGGIGGDALYGAGYGAGENNANRGLGAVTGAAAAAGGNLVGRGLLAVPGRMATGVRNADVGYLANRNIPMTPGQMLGEGGIGGRFMRGLEDKLQSVPWLGDAITARRMEGVGAFNREAFADALRPIGGNVDSVGQEGIAQAHGLVSDAYRDALGGASLRADLPFVHDAAGAVRAGRQVPEFGADIDYLVKANLGPTFGPGRTLTGEGFQSSLQDIATTAADFRQAANVRGRNAANSLGDLRQAYLSLAERQAPGAGEALQAANSANRHVSILDDATLTALNSQAGAGMFTPAQLGRAAVGNARKFGGRRQAAEGNLPFNALQRAGQAVLPSTVPNSGTTDRALATWVLPAALGGAAAGSEALDLPMPVAAGLATLGGLYTRKGNDAIQKLLTSRSSATREIGEALLRYVRMGGVLGAGTAVPATINQ